MFQNLNYGMNKTLKKIQFIYFFFEPNSIFKNIYFLEKYGKDNYIILEKYYVEIKKKWKEFKNLIENFVDSNEKREEMSIEIDEKKNLNIKNIKLKNYLKENQFNVIGKIIFSLLNNNNFLVNWIMGSGKSILCLTVICYFLKKKIFKNLILICPAFLIDFWINNIENFNNFFMLDKIITINPRDYNNYKKKYKKIKFWKENNFSLLLISVSTLESFFKNSKKKKSKFIFKKNF